MSAPDVHELGIWNANNEVEVGKGHVIRPADVHVVDWPVGAAEQLHLPRVVILLGGSESRPGQAPSCHLRVRALLQAAGWDQDPHSIAEQRTITDGRIVAIGKGFIRKRPKPSTTCCATRGISRSPLSRPPAADGRAEGGADTRNILATVRRWLCAR